MTNVKLPISLRLKLWKKQFLRWVKWKRGLSSLLLAVFTFNVGSPTALALWEMPTARAFGFGDVVSAAATSIFGKAGELLEKFDTKSESLVHQAKAKNDTTFDLVAILVDETIAENGTQYDGLISEHNSTVPASPDQAYRKLNDQTLMGRIERYAKDVQGINKVKDPQPFLKTAIIKVNPKQPTEEISGALEKLYREGDGALGEQNRLVGIVIVGDVPLPVVNKNGNRFVSVFPYTDFEDQYYVYDAVSGDFSVNTSVEKPGAEVWHGLIVPPVGGAEGNELLAEYFDKNHLFKLGEEGYSNFEKKIFYSDLQKEFKLLGEAGLPAYYQYLKYWEDISYFRFNKTWAQKVFEDSPMGKPEGDGFDNDGDGKIDEDPFNGYDDDGDAEEGSPLFGLVNRVDDDGDGEIDNDEEGVWGFCSAIPATGVVELENCQAEGKPYKTNDFYNVKPGSFYFVEDGVNNNAEVDLLIDEGIDEDTGDAFIGVDNDRDGRIDEDTSADNDLDGDKSTDEDGPGDMNGDGCPGQCGVDEDNDSVDGDMDFYPLGYERDYGTLSLDITTLPKLIDAAASGNSKEAFDSFKITTDPEFFLDFPWILFLPPVGPPFIFPRILPLPDADEWIDEGSVFDDDEDGFVDEDGKADNDNDKDGKFDEDPGDALGAGSEEGGNVFDNVADIRTRDLIMNYFKKYSELFDKFYADINVWVDGTGRYDQSYEGSDGRALSDLVTFPSLIAAKDEFTRIYLKAVNDALEKRVDRYVEKLQYDIDLVKGATLSGYVVLPDTNTVFPPGVKIKFNDANFINFGYRNDAFFTGLEALLTSLAILAPALIDQAKIDFLDSIKGPVTASTPTYINGKPIDSITNIAECSLYRGSEGDENSQMVIANTVFDPQANLNKESAPMMPAEWSSLPDNITIGTDGNDYEGLYWWWGHHADSPMVQWLKKQRLLNKAYAGCFVENANNPTRCYPIMATRYIFSLGGGKQVTGVPENAVSHQACFDLKEKEGYDEFALAAYEYLKNIGSKQIEAEKVLFDPSKPPLSAAYRAPKNIRLIDFVNEAPSKFETAPGNYVDIPPALIPQAQADPVLAALNVNLENVLKAYLGGDRVDNNSNGVVDEAAEAALQFFAINPADNQPNWLQVGEQLLQKERIDEAALEDFSKPLKFGPNVIPGTKEVYVRVSPIPGETISSLIYHKEPTVDTVQSQTYELKRDSDGNFIEDNTLSAQEKLHSGKFEIETKTAPDGTEVKVETRTAISIPIDSPRYVSFRDWEGNYQKIVYPNAFRASSLEAFKQELADLAAELAAIQVNPLYASQNPPAIDGYLTGGMQQFLDDDVMNTSFGEISVVAEKKLDDSLQWKSFNLDEKHNYALRHYWGDALNPYTELSETENGYEVLYLNSAGSADAMSLKFNKEIPEPKSEPRKDEVDCSKFENAHKLACKDSAVEPPTTGVGGGDESGGGGQELEDPVMVWEWFQKMEEWAAETAGILSGEGAIIACPAGGFTDLPGSGPVVTEPFIADVVVDVPIDLDGNGFPDQTDKTVKLILDYEDISKNILRAGTSDQTKVVVKALDVDNDVNTLDSSNQVQLTITTLAGEGPLVELLGPDTSQLAGGHAKYVLAAGDNSGTVSLQASLVDRPEVTSNSLALTVSNQVIKLLSYRRFTSYQFSEGASEGYWIMDGNGNPIAEVDPLTGRIGLLSQQYEVQVLPANGTKPLRQAVVGVENSKVYAILYFVVGGDASVNIDSGDTDYYADASSLSGVHIKDMSASDNLSLQSSAGSDVLDRTLQIIDELNSNNLGRVGLVDKRGNVFTTLPMRVKLGAASDPVVFVIDGTNGLPAFEVYVGAEFEVITELAFEDVEELFVKLGDVLLASNWLQGWALPTAHAQEDETLSGAETGVSDDTETGLIVPDTDSDGLNDLEELVIGTDISNEDTNDNGQSDLKDLESGLSPLLSQTLLFSDLQPGEQGFEEVLKLLRRGLVITDSNSAVRPEANITREEFIKLDLGGICVICDRFSEQVKESVWKVYSFTPFPDTDIADQYKYCVAEGKNRGIISGYKAFENVGYYVPKENISRAEATKVILETARQQIESFPDFVINENLSGKPWYYNYVLTAQKEGLYPQGKILALDTYSPEQFQAYFDQEVIMSGQGLPGGISNSQFILWLSQPISRVEFAIMVSRFTDKYNCLANDRDGDGLPDNLEKYVYSTNPGDPDTDHGGVKDGVEVLRGSDPNDASDDYPAPPEPDEDTDGLTKAFEEGIGSNPYDNDTDDGGVDDGTEVLLGLDPLDPADDTEFGAGSGFEDSGDGAYLAGIQIGPKTVYELPDDGSVDDSHINTEETDRVPADGDSVLYVRATLYGPDGKISSDDNVSVVNFGFKNQGDGSKAFLSPLKVKVTDGVAETVLTSKKRTGLPVVIASVDGKNIPSDQKLIEVYALEPHSAEIKPLSPIIPSGGKSTASLMATMSDLNGNLANSGNYTATFDVSSDLDGVDGQGELARLDTGQDEDKNVPGIQMSSVTGEYRLKLVSGGNPENVKVHIGYTDELQITEESSENPTEELLNLGSQLFIPATVSAETAVETRNDIRIRLKSNKIALKADQSDSAEISVRIETAFGNKLDDFEGDITLKLLNKDMGSIVDGKSGLPILTKTLVTGAALFNVKSSTKAGDLVLLASVNSLPMATYSLETYAFKPALIALAAKENEILADPNVVHTVSAKVYDAAGNFVERDNSTVLTFSLDAETAQFASITSTKQVKVVNGEADVSFRTGTLTGPVRIRAKAGDLVDGYIEVYAVNKFIGKDFRELKPKFLYADLLGSEFGAVTSEDYFGGWFVFSGKVESAVSMITDPKPKMRLVEVLPTGKVSLAGSGDLEIAVIPTNTDNAPVKQILTDFTEGKELMEVSVVPKPQSQIKLALSLDEVDRSQETVNIINLATDDIHYELESDSEKASLLKDGQLVAEIGRDAKVRLFSPTIGLINNEDDFGSEISWKITDLGTEIMTVVVSLGDVGDVKMLDDEAVPSAAGIYLRKLASVPDRSYIQSFSGNSTVAPRGYYYTDDTQELGKSQGPGLSYLSLESADTEDGIGMRGDNKNVLLFAAGNSVGESNLPYASDGGVVLGDPTVRLDNRKEPGTLDLLYTATGYTRDIGKMILAGNRNITEIVTIDYDNDSDKDLFVAYEGGEIKLIENVNTGKGFEDRGVFLNFTTGLLSQAVLDINDDGWEDLVVATADSCRVGEVCVDAYLNNKGNFVRTNLALEGYSAKNKVYMLRAADMNMDSYTDLVVSDDTGSIKVFYAHKGEINLKGSLVGNLGAKVNQTDNLKEEVFVHYSGMNGNLPGPDDDKYFEKILLKGANKSGDKTYEFKSVFNDVNKLKENSVKRVKDLTEPYDVLAEQDELEYTIILNNPANVELKNLLVGDIVPGAVELDVTSIECKDCKNEIQLIETGMSLRPYLIADIDLPAKSSRTITYKVRVGSLPKVKIAIGQNMSTMYPVKDGYPDIVAMPDQNPTGRIVYYYSINKNNSDGTIKYGEFVTPDPNVGIPKGYNPVKDANGDTVGLDLKLFEEKGPDGIPLAAKHFMDYGTFPGLDLGGAGGGNSNSSGESGGGVGDSVSSLPGVGPAYDALGNALDGAADAIEGALSALTCSAGCIPTPINVAFLAPGPFNVMGVPQGFDPGLPVFAAGVPSLIPFWPPSPYQVSQFRLYLSPTLTGKVAMAMCVGQYLVGFGPVPGNCFTIVLPIDPFAGLCEAIAGAIEAALGAANSVISDSSGTIGMSSDGSLADTPTSDGKNYTGGFEASSSMGNYGFKASASVNVRIPGFPSVLTDWVDKQSSEIINKLTDLPDIYILLPDVFSLFRTTSNGPSKPTKGIKEITERVKKVENETISPKGLRGVLNEINKVPLISIIPQDVIIKIPSLTPGEIERFVNDAKQWVEDEKAEVERVINLWKCGPFAEEVPDPSGAKDADGDPIMVPGYVDSTVPGEIPDPAGPDENGEINMISGAIVYGERPYNKICDILLVDMTDLIQSVEKNIEVIEGYKKIPRDILAWRNMLTKYVSQVICYIDAIVQFFVGNIAKWLDQASGWVDAIATLVETIATWKLMFDLVIEYQTSCDMCTTSRFTLLELILKLFAFIPSPPIIPFPKLPDLYLDFSQVQMGITILWPDLTFRPEKIVLPSLPRIVFPDLPTFQFELPAIPILPDLSLSLPELPDLPPLIIPALPNLPPPPKIPELPAGVKATISILKKIFKILCLIKKGFIPTHESVLKTTIEHMTERGLDPLLPFDLGLALQWPEISYEYVDRIVLTLKINLNKALEFSIIYDVVQYVADGLNIIATNFAETANAVSEGLENAAANQAAALNESMEEAMPDGNTEDGAFVNWLPQEIEDQLGLDPTLANEFSMFSTDLAEAVTALNVANEQMKAEMIHFQEIIERDFQDIHLVAGTTTIHPTDPQVNKSLHELEQFDYGRTMLALGDDFQETKQLANLRQNLLAYMKDHQALDEAAFQTNDLQKFAKLMARAPQVSDVLQKSGYEGGTMIAAEKTLVAQVPSLDDMVSSSGMSPSKLNNPVPKGMFIYSEEKKTNEKVLNYQEELSLPTTMNFIDVDNDTDNDLVYSFGTNVYMKENYNKSGDMGKFYGGMPKFLTLDELVPAERAVSGFSSGFLGNQTVDVSWNAQTNPDVTGYEMLYGPQLGGSSYSGVINDQNLEGLSKIVFLNTVDSTGAYLTNSILQPESNGYNFPASQLYELVATEVTGNVRFDGDEQTVLVSGGDRVRITGGQEIFAAENSMLRVWQDGEEMAKKKMSARELITFSSGFGANLEISLESGAATVLDPENFVQNQQLLPGSKIKFDTKYRSVNGGSALVKLPGQAYSRVDSGQEMEIMVLDDPESPAVTLTLENGFHYAVIRSFERAGFRSLRSEHILLGPNVCSDRQDPMPVAGPSERDVPIFKTLRLDASKSFDAFGTITSYFIDTDLTYDSNGDGDLTNDKNLGRDKDPTADSDGNGILYDDLDDPEFFLGPYKDLEQRHVMLNLIDESGNLGQQEITINIYVPKVYLDESSASLTIKEDNFGEKVSGSIDPVESDIPIAIIRNRNGVKELIETPSAGVHGKYFTDADGLFSLSDLNLHDTIVIKDAQGNVVAEIDPKTGRVVLKNPAYSVEALPAEEPLLPTRVVVKDPLGEVVATIFVVSNALTDVVMDSADTNYTAASVALFQGVHIKNLLSEQSEYQMLSIDTEAESYPGAVEIVAPDSQKRIALLDKTGNFYIYDSSFKLDIKTANDLKEPMIFQFAQEGGGENSVLTEFYIAFDSSNPLTILDPDKYKVFVGDEQVRGPKFDTDKDGMPDQWEQQYTLNFQSPADASQDPDGDKLTNLDEYLAGTNPFLADSDADGYDDGFEKTFGKDPNAAATSPFTDVTPDNPFYQSILNFFQRGILDGIPSGNQVIFGFNQPIERAEFAKVILDTFCIVPRPEAYESPGVFTDIPYNDQGNPWYFAPTKEAYFQGFITGYRGQIDERTGRTPFAPEETITMAEAVKVILEALEREGVISLAKLPITEPYYLSYMQVAQNLGPHLDGDIKLKSNFIVTAQEAQSPEKDLTRGQFIELADRVLTAYDCSLFDTDGDGMPDYWENLNDLKYLDPSDADDDPDGDRLLNLQEYKYGTDPHNPDTDFGGVKDGVEVLDRQTNPLDPKDDYLDRDGDGLSDEDEENIYKTDPGEKDTDKGGVTDGDEVLKNGTNPLNQLDDRDTDGDGLGDIEEQTIYHTDYLNPDTDEGGVQDGAEVYRGTDPLDPKDDLIDPRSDLADGVYAIPAACSACPCESAIDHTADLIPGDKIIGVISNDQNTQIFSQSNLVTIEEISE